VKDNVPTWPQLLATLSLTRDLVLRRYLQLNSTKEGFVGKTFDEDGWRRGEHGGVKMWVGNLRVCLPTEEWALRAINLDLGLIWSPEAPQP